MRSSNSIKEKIIMSINALANAAAARRSDFFPAGVPGSISEIAKASATQPTAISNANVSAQPVGNAAVQPALEAQGSNAVNTALNVLFGYIPTEVLTLYVAVLAAIEKPDKVTQGQWITFYIFLAATPIIVWLVYGAKVKAEQKPLPLAFQAWPVWEMVAATLAFGVWAFALPKTPFTAYAWYSAALAGIAVLVASTILGLLAPFFQRQIVVSKPQNP